MHYTELKLGRNLKDKGWRSALYLKPLYFVPYTRKMFSPWLINRGNQGAKTLNFQ